MVEMVETAAILNQATPHSLVIMDEIGRGTATYDGVSIAWAVAEHLHEVTRCRALFATHYHELTDLAESLPALRNYHAAVKEYQGQVVFLHELRAGAADKSYGIHVAALAGLPTPVLTRARQLLNMLEAEHHLGRKNPAQPMLPFAAAGADTPPDPHAARYRALAAALAAIDTDHTTPREALDILHALKSQVTSGTPEA
jgi:DNA mismatch repair protein MutS